MHLQQEHQTNNGKGLSIEHMDVQLQILEQTEYQRH
jgi:hypothetical protein